MNDDREKIEKGERLLEQIDMEKWTEYKRLSKKVINTTLNSMGASTQGPLRLDDIMHGFASNFQVNMSIDKKNRMSSDEVLDLQ